MSSQIRVIDGTIETVSVIANQIGMRDKMALDNVVRSVNEILSNVKSEGDEAVAAYTKRFDRVSLAANSFIVSSEAINDAYAQLPEEDISILSEVRDNIKAYHETQLKNSAKGFMTTGPGGGEVGMVVRPLERVGLYVPGGTAPLPSSVLMNAIPAIVAGVDELIMCTPPLPDGTIAPAILVAADLAGVHKIYRIGGAQAIAAMAYGTETIPPVDKICGPGNIYVNTAKRLVYGTCDIDMFAGPSEILIIADETADPRFVACDMLSQAEHDSLASALLLTTSDQLIKEVLSVIDHYYSLASRRDILSESLRDYAAIVKVQSLEQGVEFANGLAPEHLELCVEESRIPDLLASVKNAGAVFLGHFSPEPLGDYYAGPNHVLPTSGTARFFSPLNVEDFRKKMSIIHYNQASLNAVAESVERLAMVEQLDCHARSVTVRRKAIEEGHSKLKI
ncbi:MAG: histidinol dehydrogenase [Fastidiosipilaceae bacterium]|nr:histidinol dehydrogenase [Clostridiaceae bacterium]